MTKFNKAMICVIMLGLLIADNTLAATSTAWTSAPKDYYNSAKSYPNGSYDGYSFIINKIAKSGKTTDNSDYTYANMWLVATNAKMYLEYQKTFQNKNQWEFAAKKGKTYAYNFIDVNGTIGANKTGLNVLVKTYESKATNVNITHTIN